jgi:hypothetical protein
MKCFNCKRKGHLARDCCAAKANVAEECQGEMSGTESCNTVTVATARSKNELLCVEGLQKI